MRMRRDSSMTLSSEMLRLADSYYKKQCYAIDNKYRMNFANVKLQIMATHNHFIAHRFYVEWAEEKVAARVETYIEAFKREGLIPSDGDINEIKWDLEYIILNVTETISVESKDILKREKMRIIDTGCHDIDIFIQETKLDQKRAEAREPHQPSVTHNTVNILGNNQGNIQLDGVGNKQTLGNKTDDET